MMLEKSNAPAFPKSHDPYPNCQETTDTSVYLGLTKREYFAGQAMIAAGNNWPTALATAARAAVALADALLAELAK